MLFSIYPDMFWIFDKFEKNIIWIINGYNMDSLINEWNILETIGKNKGTLYLMKKD